MSISGDEVAKVALLARLQLTDEELDVLTVQLSKIVDYVDQLSQLETDHVEPLAHAMDLANVLAADQVQPSLAREEVLASAPHQDGECFLVPAVLGQQ